jgi:thiol reductant ABC exporter CydD subunit
VLLVADIALGVLTAVLVLLQATLLAHIVARAFEGAGLEALAVEVCLLAACFGLRGVAAWGFEVAGVRAAASVLSKLRLEIVERRLRSHPAALDRTESGELAAAAVQGVDALGAYFGRYLPQVVLACVVPVAVLAWVAAIDVTTAVIMLVTLPVVPVFMWLIGRYTEERSRERWYSLRLLSTHFLEVVRGLPTLRAFNRSAAQAEAIEDVSERYRRATMQTLRVSFLSGSVLELAATIGVALVAVTVGVRLDRGAIGFQAALVALILAPELYLPLRQLGTQFHASADGLAVAERIITVLESAPDVPRHGARIAPTPAEAAIRFERVSFGYPGRTEPVLDGFELLVQPGETLALVGPSGAGKSTVVRLLLGFAAPSSGRITAGAIDLASVRLDSWHRQIAWVPQRPTIFRGTIADNIRLGTSAASDARVRHAALSAGADAFARDLPDGYDTVVGDGGRPLSAGEARRIALARAFVRDAPLLVLDEPTADLDAANAELVAHAVEHLCADRTVLLIAHRPELALLADRVALLENGRATAIAESVAA